MVKYYVPRLFLSTNHGRGHEYGIFWLHHLTLSYLQQPRLPLMRSNKYFSATYSKLLSVPHHDVHIPLQSTTKSTPVLGCPDLLKMLQKRENKVLSVAEGCYSSMLVYPCTESHHLWCMNLQNPQPSSTSVSWNYCWVIQQWQQLQATSPHIFLWFSFLLNLQRPINFQSGKLSFKINQNFHLPLGNSNKADSCQVVHCQHNFTAIVDHRFITLGYLCNILVEIIRILRIMKHPSFNVNC